MLNCVDISNQEVLLKILLKHHENMKSSCMNTLEKYAIELKHVDILPMETELECVSAAGGTQMRMWL